MSDERIDTGFGLLRSHLVGLLGVEPRPRAPKARILPLYYSPLFRSLIESGKLSKQIGFWLILGRLLFKMKEASALVVQWIEQRSSKASMGVRFPPRAQKRNKSGLMPGLFRFVFSGIEPRAAGVDETPKVSSFTRSERRFPPIPPRAQNKKPPIRRFFVAGII